MFPWIIANIGTILISLVLVAVVAGIVYKLYRDKKRGKATCSCGGSCGHCPMSGSCHSH